MSPRRDRRGQGVSNSLVTSARSQAFVAQYMRSSLFPDVAQRRFVVCYRHFGTACSPHLLKANMSFFLGVMTLLQELIVTQLLEELFTIYEITLHLHLNELIPSRCSN